MTKPIPVNLPFERVPTKGDGKRSEFMRELEALINRYSLENGSNTPDFLLATYLSRCLDAFNEIVTKRESWYGRRSDAPAVPKGKPTIAELEAILASPEPHSIEIQPDGSIRAVPLSEPTGRKT